MNKGEKKLDFIILLFLVNTRKKRKSEQKQNIKAPE